MFVFNLLPHLYVLPISQLLTMHLPPVRLCPAAVWCLCWGARLTRTFYRSSHVYQAKCFGAKSQNKHWINCPLDERYLTSELKPGAKRVNHLEIQIVPKTGKRIFYFFVCFRLLRFELVLGTFLACLQNRRSKAQSRIPVLWERPIPRLWLSKAAPQLKAPFRFHVCSPLLEAPHWSLRFLFKLGSKYQMLASVQVHFFCMFWLLRLEAISRTKERASQVRITAMCRHLT